MTQKLFFCNCNCKCKFLVHCMCVCRGRRSHCGSGVKDNCNMLVISILYNGKMEGVECSFPCFLPEFDAIFHARKIAKRIVLISCFTQFWACNEADEPHFSALYTPKLHLCTLVPMPGTPVSSYPKPPFGMSHFAIWDVPFCLLGYIFGTFAHNVQPRCPIWLLRFRCKSMCVFFSVQENRPAYPTAKIFILYMAKERKSFYIFVQ